MPVKDTGNYLIDCLGSVLNQDFTKWELIIVNDHSGKSTTDLLKSYAAKDHRITLLENQGSGIVPALITGFSKARGRYISRFDSDDIMPEKRLSIMYNLIDNSPKGTIVTGKIKYFSSNAVSNGYLKYEDWVNAINKDRTQWKYIYRECVIASPNWIVSKADLMNVGAFENLLYPEDYHLVLKWYEYKYSIKYTDDITLLWREHPKRISRTSEMYSQRSFFNLKINAFMNLDDRGGDLVIWGNNKKAVLAMDILRKLNRNFIQMSLKERNDSIRNFNEIEKLMNPQLLIAVYPDYVKRMKIETYLSQLNMVMGRDYWYL